MTKTEAQEAANMGLLDGKAALVTGGASGIGLAAARRFAEEGAQVAIADRNADGAAEAAREIGSEAVAVGADVTNEDDVANMVRSCIDRFGRLDIAFNNAGIGGFSPIQDYPLAQFQQVIDVCLTGVFLCIKHESKHLIEQGSGGSIINTASLNSIQATEGLSAYCSAKAGVAMLTKVSALELGRYGIRVNSIGPGLIRTPLTQGLRDIPELEDAFAHEAPLGRIGEPEDVAQLALWLASDASSLMTGQTVQLNGGADINKYPPLFEFFGQRAL
ncbi:MAG: SDR family oxidoreductase [Chloroflexi bacterium]|nr:SDR family oxidoreductase [Chloroflexota bacterium]MYD16348.1 SDR family oxidoreductase [Chloroflexota bacterium]MYJ01836.1 SDR family oxidoreductase [Chloroflexota bacterium]